MVAIKMKSMPLSEVMLGDRQGGWGRSIKGAERLIAKLMRNDDTRSQANSLRAYVDLVLNLAKCLWPERIFKVSETLLERAVTDMKKHGCDLPAQVQSLLVHRKALAVIDELKTAEDKAACASKLFDLLRPSAATSSDFDPLTPKMADMGSVRAAERWNLFHSLFVKKVLVPRIADGEASMSLVRLCSETVLEPLEGVSWIDLDEKSATLCKDVVDSVRALLAVVSDPESFLKYQDEFVALEATPTAAGTAMSATCMAIKHNKDYPHREIEAGEAKLGNHCT